MLKRLIVRTFLTGLVALLPFAVTVAILVWIAMVGESAFGGLVKAIVPDRFYYRGMGLAVGFAIIFAFGLLLRAYVVRKIFEFGESLVQRIPVVKTLYGTARDLMAFLSEKKPEFNQVVIVNIGSTGLRQLGLVTRSDFRGCPRGLAKDGEATVAVYLPMSYQMGGYTTLVPGAWLEPVDMSFEDAMRFVLTAGMSAHQTAPAAEALAAPASPESCIGPEVG